MTISVMKKILFIIICLSLACGGCGKTNSERYSGDMSKIISVLDNVENAAREEVYKNATERHAFIMADGLVFVADIPKDWRYILHPVYDYIYCKSLPDTNRSYIEDKHYIEFIGTGVEDGEDNFFIITVGEGEGAFEGEFSLNMTDDEKLSLITSTPFVFRDGTLGTQEYQVWEGSLLHSMGDIKAVYYEGIVQDGEGKYHIHLFMLKDEYDANEQTIMNFLESICFSKSNAGVYENKGLLERELLTMHLWDEYLNMSFLVPEGAVLEKNDYYNDASYKVRSYKIYLDRDKHTYFEIISDQGGEIVERTGDSRYHLNTRDFDETVYELTGYGGGYYFPNWHLWVKTNIGDKNTELVEYIKQIMRSFRFE